MADIRLHLEQSLLHNITTMPNELATMAVREDAKHGNTTFPIEVYPSVVEDNYPVYYKNHWHQEAEIIFVEKGSLTVNINSQSIVLNADCFYILPCKLAHSLVKSGKSVMWFMVFNPEMIRLAYYDPMLTKILDALQDTSLQIKPISSKKSKYFEEEKRCYNTIRELVYTKNLTERLLVKAKLTELLVYLYQDGVFNHIEVNTSLEQVRAQKFKELISWIQDHHSGPLSIEDAASRMNFSNAYFCRFFKQITHMSFTEFVNDYRLTQACDDIMQGTKAIADIAADHGFDNESYFFRLFKKKYGVTPLKYRKQS